MSRAPKPVDWKLLATKLYKEALSMRVCGACNLNTNQKNHLGILFEMYDRAKTRDKKARKP